MSSLSLKEYQEDRKERGVYDKRNSLNDLTGKEWLFSTKTIIPREYSPLPENIVSPDFNALPIQLCKEIIETFTKPGETILDPFAGIGTIIIGSLLANENFNSYKKRCIGIERHQIYNQKFQKLLEEFNLSKEEIKIGYPLSILKTIKNDSIDLIFTDLPIWNYLDFVPNDKYFFNINMFKEPTYDVFQNWSSTISEVLLEASNKLKKSRYMIIAISANHFQSDNNRKDIPGINFALSSILSSFLQSYGLILKSERIWFKPAIKTDISNLRPIQRRFLVFRKEFIPISDLNNYNIFFKDNFPIGETKILHKTFPPSYDHKLRSQHGGMKPPELAEFLIKKYTQDSNGLILDPFAGVGGMLLGASLTGRQAIGIDINEKWRDIYLQVAHNANLSPQKFLIGDSQEIIGQTLEGKNVDMVLTDVPYWAMDKLTKTRGRYSKAGEESSEKLPSPLKQFNKLTILTIDEWEILMQKVFSLCYEKLLPGKYLVVFIGNMYRTINTVLNGKKTKIGKYLMLSSRLTRVLIDLGYNFESEIIWYSPDKALHVFGYPYVYIPSVVHQSILVFRK